MTSTIVSATSYELKSGENFYSIQMFYPKDDGTIEICSVVYDIWF